MNTKTNSDQVEPTARPAAIIVLAVALVGLVLWSIGPSAYSRANPYLNDVPQAPTGVISDTEGTVSEAEDM